MSGASHIHIDDIIVDSDVHFTIDTVTRIISNRNGDKANEKLILTQYDNNSERYSFDIDRIIDRHDLLNCNRVQIHYVNIGSGKNDKPNIGSYLVDDVHVHETDPNKITFSWLVSRNATLLNGTLSFLVSFECIDGDKVLYRWSTTTFEGIQITVGMDNDNAIMEQYVDELLVWQNNMALDHIPNLVDECYIEREFATSEEVREIFDIYDPAVDELIGTDTIPTDGSNNLITSGGVKYYTDSAINDVKDIFNDYYAKVDTYSKVEINEIITGGAVDLTNYYTKDETYSQDEIDEIVDNVQVDLSDYYTKSETYSQDEIDEIVDNVQVDLSDYYTKSETYSQTEVNDLVSSFESDLDNKADKSEIPDVSGKVDKVEGKGLSTNDYTTAEKNKLAGLENYDDSAIQQSITELQNGKADKSEIPDISGKADKTEIPDISGKADKSEIPIIKDQTYEALLPYTGGSNPTMQTHNTEPLTERAIATALPYINGSHDYTANLDIYAPTSSGTTGQILVANTSENAYGGWATKTVRGTPTWKDPSELGLVTTNELESELTSKADKSELTEIRNGKADRTELSSYVTNDALEKKGYLTSVPDRYITELELENELSSRGYLTHVPSEYITETELNNKGYLTSIPDEYITENELNFRDYATNSSLSNYYTKKEVTSITNNLYDTKLDKTDVPYTGDFITKYVDNLENYYKKTESYSKTELSDILGTLNANKADKTELDNYVTNAALQSKGYLTSIPSEYITETELADKKYLTSIPSEYITETELNNKGYLTSIPSEYITETELNNKGYLTAIPDSLTTDISNAYAQIREENTQAGMLTWTNAKKGYICVRTDLKKTFMLSREPSSEVDNWIELKAPYPYSYAYDLTVESMGLTLKKMTNGQAEGSRVLSIVNDLYGSSFTTDVLSAQQGKVLKDLIDKKANTTELSNYVTNTALDSKGYLTEIPSEYITETELNNKGYLTEIPSDYITETELNGKGYLTSIPSEYITETELNNKGYLTSLPSNVAYKDKTNTFTQHQYIGSSLVFNRDNPVCIEAYVGQTGGDLLAPLGSVFRVNNTEGVVEIGGNTLPIQASGLTDGTTTKSMSEILAGGGGIKLRRWTD